MFSIHVCAFVCTHAFMYVCMQYACIHVPELLDRSQGPPPDGTKRAHRSRSISDVSSFSTVSVLSFYPIRVRALCVKQPQVGCISSKRTLCIHVCMYLPFSTFKSLRDFYLKNSVFKYQILSLLLYPREEELTF